MPNITLASRLLPDQCVYWANITMFPCFPRPHSVTGLTQVAQPMSMVLMVLTLPASSASSPYLPTSHPSLWVFVCHLYLSGILHALLFAGNLLLRFRSGILSSRKIYAITHTHTLYHTPTLGKIPSWVLTAPYPDLCYRTDQLLLTSLSSYLSDKSFKMRDQALC